MEVYNVKRDNIILFSNVLIDAAKLLIEEKQSMWRETDLSSEELLKYYKIEDMRLCYDNGELVGAYILQWSDPLFWPELPINEAGVIHKLAVCTKFKKQGYGKKILDAAEAICRVNRVKSMRLNCGTARLGLRNFYERSGLEMVDRVFIDNRDQIRYVKTLVY
jgi:GNAT superfamily N-acetyltransferase